MSIQALTGNYFWSSENEEVLKEAYAKGGPKDGLRLATEALPGVSRGTIATKACRLKITSPKPRKANSVYRPVPK